MNFYFIGGWMVEKQSSYLVSDSLLGGYLTCYCPGISSFCRILLLKVINSGSPQLLLLLFSSTFTGIVASIVRDKNKKNLNCLICFSAYQSIFVCIGASLFLFFLVQHVSLPQLQDSSPCSNLIFVLISIDFLKFFFID